MNYTALDTLKKRWLEGAAQAEPQALASFERSFAVAYAHNSTAIEGNSLTLIQTKAVLEDGVSVGGKSLREIYEVVNHDKAFRFVKERVSKGEPLSENLVKDIHAILMENILPGGFYRNTDVRISGASHHPPSPVEMYGQVKRFFAELPTRTDLHPIELAAWTHAEFVRIHPFIEGNGRTSRMMMNYQLLSAGFLPVSIRKEDRLPYFEKLEAYAVNGDLEPFAKLVAALEREQLEERIRLIPSTKSKRDLHPQTAYPIAPPFLPFRRRHRCTRCHPAAFAQNPIQGHFKAPRFPRRDSLCSPRGKTSDSSRTRRCGSRISNWKETYTMQA